MYIFRQAIVPTLPGQVKELSRCWEKLLPLAIRKINYKKGSSFFFSEENPNSFAYIRHGTTATIGLLPNAEEYIKLFIGEGCLFHEAYIFAGFCNSFPLHRCLSDVEIYQFDGNLLIDPDFQKRYPEQYHNALWQMSVKTSALDMIADIAAKKTVAMKIANFLLIYVQVMNGNSFSPHVTQLELGLMLNIHKSSLNREIQNFVDMGIIDGFTKKRCTVIDLQKLQLVAEGKLLF
ncbi:Crp/Fnr family transcriptional regulator [Mailhella massiliensis]|uniref:Crp/Fnr family transcriptional regulator n=1 Tax=Mailhella massiliensis TaxID=1903261 RepID=UPI0013902646|nr:Crp/Fnr family transcriptional regulator [Mailhella massiliensis]